MKCSLITLSVGRLLLGTLFVPSGLVAGKNSYEIWASDQSNSEAGQGSLGVKGSFLWIFSSSAVEAQLRNEPSPSNNAVPLSCLPGVPQGPCDMLDVFPSTLANEDGTTLGNLPNFGRLHGVIADPQQKYVVANFFVPEGGYVGVIKVATKEAIALFRVTEFTYRNASPTNRRSVHMSYWDDKNGGYILVDNLHGKAIERINVVRNSDGDITDLQFDKSATLGLGCEMSVVSEAQAFSGQNAFGRSLIGSSIGTYSTSEGLSDLTPAGAHKESDCPTSAPNAIAMGERPNNIPICPITSLNQHVYITLAGGGMFVADITTSPMRIIAEYGNQAIYGAGCGGVPSQDGGTMFMNTGVSASSAGAVHSMFAVFAFDDNAMGTVANAQNTPMPDVAYADSGNTASLGNVGGQTDNTSGQIPGVTTRRDSHGTDLTIDGTYLHTADRIQNNVEVLDISTYSRTTYSLTDPPSAGATPVCTVKGVTDDNSLPPNDPAPDLMNMTPDSKYLMIALRGPTPVSVAHAAQGSCPGVGIVELTEGGRMGKLVDVIRTTNLVGDTLTSFAATGGHTYTGDERSDVHGVEVISLDTCENNECRAFFLLDGREYRVDLFGWFCFTACVPAFVFDVLFGLLFDCGSCH